MLKYYRSIDNSDESTQVIQEYLFGHTQCTLNKDSPHFASENQLNDAIEQIWSLKTVSNHLNEPANLDTDYESGSKIPEWQCNFNYMYPHDETESHENPNSKMMKILRKMCVYYEYIINE